MTVVTNVARFRSGMPSTASSSWTRRAAAIGAIASSGIAPSGAFSVIQPRRPGWGAGRCAQSRDRHESVEGSKSIMLTPSMSHPSVRPSRANILKRHERGNDPIPLQIPSRSYGIGRPLHAPRLCREGSGSCGRAFDRDDSNNRITARPNAGAIPSTRPAAVPRRARARPARPGPRASPRAARGVDGPRRRTGRLRQDDLPRPVGGRRRAARSPGSASTSATTIRSCCWARSPRRSTRSTRSTTMSSPPCSRRVRTSGTSSCPVSVARCASASARS